MAYVIYVYEDERYDVTTDLEDYSYEDYSILYEDSFDKCIEYLERL